MTREQYRAWSFGAYAVTLGAVIGLYAWDIRRRHRAASTHELVSEVFDELDRREQARLFGEDARDA